MNNNVDRFYKHYEEMTALINRVTDENLRLDLWEKLQWLKCDFDCYRGQQEPDDAFEALRANLEA